MTTTKEVRGECQHCGGQFDFPAEQAGMTANCPHCGQPTELLLATPPEPESPIRARAVVLVVLTLVIGVGGVIGAQLAIKRARRMVGQDTTAAPASAPAPKPADSFTAREFRTTPVTLERQAGSKLVHAVGTISNTANRQCFGVKVELDLFDAAGKRIASASDYIGVIEPGGEWKFRALVVETEAASAKISTIKETK